MLDLFRYKHNKKEYTLINSLGKLIMYRNKIPNGGKIVNLISNN